MRESHPSDLTAQMSFLSVDDKRFREDRKRRRRKPDPLPDVPDGPCCLRCRNWRPPGPHDDFGECRVLQVLLDRAPGSAEKGTIVSVEEAIERYYGTPREDLRTRAFFAGCSRYVDVARTKDDAA